MELGIGEFLFKELDMLPTIKALPLHPETLKFMEVQRRMNRD